LEAAVCVDCVDPSCFECGSGSSICEECEVGFVLSDEGKCVDCDDKDYTECEACSLTGNSDETECTQCVVGYRLDGGTCVMCDEQLLCNTCDEVYKCIECSTGFRLEAGECIDCEETLNHCDACTFGDSCD
jgi:hypothetical protein